jgi:parvulin-like peptidyl-prolyl isomerase
VTRTTRLLAASALGTLVLTGCGGGAVQTGAAATVGNERVTTVSLESVVARSLKDPGAQQTLGADRPTFERAVLRRLINHLLVTAAAKTEAVTIDGAAVDAVLDRFAQQAGGEEQLKAEAVKQGIAPADLREALSDVALRDALADKLTASLAVPEATLQQAYQQNIAQYDQVHSAHILVATEAKAKQILAAVIADPTRFAEMAKQFSTDTSNKDTGGDLGFQGRGALEKSFEAAIFTNKPGSFVIAKTQYGFHVINVIERRTTTFAQARADLRRGLLDQERQTALQALMLKTAASLGVTVNPRFGAWKAATQEVVGTTGNGVTAVSPRPDDSAPTPSPTP